MRALVVGAWCAVALGTAIGGWPLSALVVCVPGLVAATLLAGGRETIGLRLAMAVVAMVLAISPSSLSVAELVDPGPGGWWFRVAALAPVALAVLAVPGARRAPAAVGWLVALAAWATVAAPFTPLPTQSALAGLELLVVVVVVDRLVRALGWYDTVASAAVGIAVVAVAAVVVELVDVTPIRLPGFEETTDLGIARLSGFATEPIQLAESAGAGALLGLLVALTARQRAPVIGSTRTWRSAGLGVAAGCLVALAGTQSRVGVLAVIVAIAWALLRRRRRSIVAVGVVVAAGALILIGLGGLQSGPFERVLTIRGDGGNETDIRVTEIWPASVDRFLERPIQGWGLAGTEEAMQRSMDARDIRPLPVRNTHNRLTELAVSTGLVGLALGVAALMSIVGHYWRHPAPEVEALVVYVIVVGTTSPGSGSLFAGIDELCLAIAAAATAVVSSGPAPTSVPHRLPVRG